MQLHTPPMTKINKYLISVLSGFFILEFFSQLVFKFSLSSFLSLSFAGVTSGVITQLFTYVLVSGDIISFVFSMLIIWFIGCELEENWGERFYIKFLGASILATGIFFFLLVLSFPQLRLNALSGSHALGYSLLVGYALVYPERELSFMFLFPVKAMYFCLLLAAISFFNALSSNGAASAGSQLFSLVFAFAYLKYLSSQANSGGTKKPKKRESHLRIVKDEDSDDPKYWH